MKYYNFPKHCLNQKKQLKKYDFLILFKTKPLKKGNGTDYYLDLEYLDKYVINLLDNEIGK